MQAIQALPYLMTVILLAGVIGTRHPAARLGHSLCEGALTWRPRYACSRPPEAIQAKAYAPYSRFKVGAAIASRQTAGSLPAAMSKTPPIRSAVCAEAGAISAMIAAGESRIAAIVVIGDGEHLVTPCGGCRQRIREFAAPDTPIHIAGPEGIRRSFTLDELLPFSFGPDNLTDR